MTYNLHIDGDDLSRSKTELVKHRLEEGFNKASFFPEGNEQTLRWELNRSGTYTVTLFDKSKDTFRRPKKPVLYPKAMATILSTCENNGALDWMDAMEWEETPANSKRNALLILGALIGVGAITILLVTLLG